jgi:transposase
MDTSSEAVNTDTLGRRTGPRQKHTIEQKRRIVEETHERGASVAVVARRHGVNANQVFGWRQLYRRGLLEVTSAQSAPAMLPIKVATPTLLPTERSAARVVPKEAPRRTAANSIEIELGNGRCVRVHGRVDIKVLTRIIDALERR